MVPPDWFDRFWQQIEPKLPFLLRNPATKELAKDVLGIILNGVTQYAQTAEGMRQIVAFARIAAVLKGTRGVLESPDPSPEEIAAAVERLVERIKP